MKWLLHDEGGINGLNILTVASHSASDTDNRKKWKVLHFIENNFGEHLPFNVNNSQGFNTEFFVLPFFLYMI